MRDKSGWMTWYKEQEQLNVMDGKIIILRKYEMLERINWNFCLVKVC